MKKIGLLVVLLSCVSIYGQCQSVIKQRPLEFSQSDSIRWNNIPHLTYDKSKGAKLLLPERVDNSTNRGIRLATYYLFMSNIFDSNHSSD